ncbi:MAG TPA: hypothetical protein VKS60_07335 [Stellaceae bacterium]|nr:hypothetical protein [Stellaceae bacterium]
MSALIDRVIKAAGTLALVVIAVALVAGRGGSVTMAPETAATAVTVTNPFSKPLPTRSADNPAFQPVQFRVFIEIPDTIASAAKSVYTVPTGQRLVIQTVSAYRTGTVAANQSVQLFVDGSFGGAYGSLALPSIPAIGMDPGTTLVAPFYADPGTAVELYDYRTGSSGDEFDYVTVTGYLVNLP